MPAPQTQWIVTADPVTVIDHDSIMSPRCATEAFRQQVIWGGINVRCRKYENGLFQLEFPYEIPRRP